MKLDKAERILENFMEQRNCPDKVRIAIKTIMDDGTHQFHRVHFAQAYLEGMTALTEEDVSVLREGIH